MVHWFMKRMGALLFAAPVMALIFVLLNTTGSTQSSKLEEDSDGDNMNDAYELFYGLNSTNPADGLLDYDGDALTNLAESVKLTDPFYEDTDRDGFNDDKDDQISRAYIQWGNPQFTAGDQYEYAHPDWFLGAYKDGGEWVVDLTTTQSCWYVSAYGSNGVGSLCVDLDRTILTNNLRYAIHYLSSIVRHGETTEDSVGNNSSLYVDLLDTNGVVVVENLYGSLISGSNVDATILLEIPTAKFPDAAVIQLRSGNVGAPPCPAVASERRRIVGDRSEDLPAVLSATGGLQADGHAPFDRLKALSGVEGQARPLHSSICREEKRN